VDTARGSRHVTGENAVTVSAWQGVGFGQDGFLTLTGEYLKRQPTNRADFDPRVNPTRVTGRYGDPEVEQGTGFLNAGTSLTDTWSLYGWLGYQERDSKSAAFPRVAAVTASAAQLAVLARAGYPSGFLPIINTQTSDLNSALGVRGQVAGFDVDLSGSYGRNRIGFRTLGSANYAFGTATPRDFNDGALIYDQYVVGLDFTRRFDVFQSLNVAFGVEGRREGYKIEAGELASYGAPPAGTVTGIPASTAVSLVPPGAQGFGGFSPGNEIERSRRNGSIYLDVEAQVTDKLLVGLAGRAEDYSDFGSTATGKLSARYEVADWLALRATASTGFRAPSLQQQYFTQTAQVVQNGVPIETGTFPSVSPVARALGGLELDAEKSTNLSAGAVIRAGGFDLTVDAYRIRIRNQIGLSENIQASFSPQVAAILTPFNVSAARFFINGLASTTKGIDVVGHYRLRTAAAGSFDVTVAGNLNDANVTRVPVNTAVTLTPTPTLFARSRILTLEDGTPQTKVTGTIDWSLDRIGAL
ncbi:MAG: TonB-dependent receptor, partial [Methylobacterium sp.]